MVDGEKQLTSDLVSLCHLNQESGRSSTKIYVALQRINNKHTKNTKKKQIKERIKI